MSVLEAVGSSVNSVFFLCGLAQCLYRQNDRVDVLGKRGARTSREADGLAHR